MDWYIKEQADKSVKWHLIKTKIINDNKFDVKDVSEVVGGLWEVDPTIDRDKLDFEVVQEMSNYLGYTIRHDILTNKEEDLLFERGHRRMTEKDWYLYGNNDNFEMILWVIILIYFVSNLGVVLMFI